jgi:Calx-beta domain/Domain of unknown function (DUF4214)
MASLQFADFLAKIRIPGISIAAVSLFLSGSFLAAGRTETNKIAPETVRGDASSIRSTVAGSRLTNWSLVPTVMPLSMPIFQENFDGVTPPALPTGWTSASSASASWTTSTTTPDTASNDAFGSESANIGDTSLTTPAIAIPASSSYELQFRTLFNLEQHADGMVLEININGVGWQDIVAAGGSFANGGYNGVIDQDLNNPLDGRQAWTGLSYGTTDAPSYITTLVNLPSSANGQSIQLRWRIGTDDGTFADGQLGVRIDTISITAKPDLSCTFSEGFDNVSNLPSSGWVQINRSQPLGTTGWFQGNHFAPQSGASNSYIAADFNNAADPPPSTISNWLLTPQLMLADGARFTFYTRRDRSDYAERLQVRMSLNSTSSNVGTSATSVGDFGALLADIDPTYRTVDGYPNDWSQFTITLTGVGTPKMGRLAFRYFVENGGPSGGSNSFYIGIDTVQLCSSAAPTPTPTTIQFNSASYSVGEGDGHANITVTRSGDTSGAATVDYRTTDTDTFTVSCADTVNNHGSAYARCDFATVAGTLSFVAGETTKTIVVPVVDDSYAEGNETFNVVLSNPTGAILGSPSTATVMIVDNDTVNGPNPILQTDNAGVAFFVRQHYLDFLGREPEAGEPWSAILRGCADQFNVDPNSPSAGCDRITVSGAFFGSPEFKDKGFYVIDFYRVAFGRLPQYSEFVTDLASLVGTTAQEVFARRAAFANNFVQRPEFATIAAMSNSSYVMTLMAGTNGQNYNLTSITTPDPNNPDGTTKVTLTTNDLINGLNANTLTKAQVLRAIVQSDQITNIEAVSTFVASQYYGYLRRTPDTAGFNNWVNYLTAHPTDFRTMVNGFMNSTEYRLRFGQP